MPLTELLRMINGEANTTQERAPNSSDPSSRPETDFCELVWENGNVMMQGQSSKPRKGPPTTNHYHSMIPKFQDGRDTNNLKTNNFNSMDSVLGDFTSVVPSCETDLGQDNDMVPWLSYPVEDHLHNDYNCEFLPELSGITMNNISTNSHIAFREKKAAFHGDDHHNSESLKRHDRSKVDSNTQIVALSSQNIPRSGVSDNTGGNVVSNTQNVASRDFNSQSPSGFTSLRLQKLDSEQPGTSTSFTNFPYFSRSGAHAKANHLTVNTSKRLESDEQRCTVTVSNPVDSTLINLASACSQREIGTHTPSVQAPTANEDTELLPKNPSVELISAKRIIRNDDVINNTHQNHALDATMSKVGVTGERNMEPVVAASSVCSGNSVGKASNERPDLKRKLRETTESEGPSEEVEEESLGAKKAAHARASSKRIRAAEVHNLSERRRRDRINEKMRALQELIPNCNKVDKASMLDEAIEYLKTLQLQLQMFSMGPGLYMQPMMLPPGMQPIHGAQMPHFPPMGIGLGMGMGMGMGFGTNMLDVNNGMKMIPFQSPHYPTPGGSSPFHGLPGSSIQPFGHTGQGLQMSMHQAQVHPNPGAFSPNLPMGLNISGVAGSSGALNLVPPSITKELCPPVLPNNIPNMYMNQATNQATRECIHPSPSLHDRRRAGNGTNNAT